MNYLVLARKYRPHQFQSLVGQDHVVQALTNALVQKRLHHAYLFTGTRGVGKTTVSRILAKSLNCVGVDGLGGITDTPCGQCQACQGIDGGRFADYIELDAASHRGVEEITQLLDQAVYQPVAGRFKVYMIDEVHMLSNTAFNAMLKTLEEPPDYLKFILATTDPQKVPLTVLSRCLQFHLRAISPDTIQAHLMQVLGKEGISSQPGAIRLLALAAQGSMRDALSLADQAIAYGAGVLTGQGVRQMLGAVDERFCIDLMTSLIARDGAALVSQCHDLRLLGQPCLGTLDTLAELCHQAAVFQVAPDGLMNKDPDYVKSVSNFAAQLPSDELQLFYSMCLHGRAELHLASDEYSGLVMVLLRMLSFRSEGGKAAETKSEPIEPIEPSVQNVQNVQNDRVDQTTQTTHITPPNHLQSASPGEQWVELVTKLTQAEKITALVRELAWNSQCLAIDCGHEFWHLRVDSETLRSSTHRDKLQSVLADYLGHSVRLQIDAGTTDDTPAKRLLADRQSRYDIAEKDVMDDPWVHSILSQYTTARIVPGSIQPLSSVGGSL